MQLGAILTSFFKGKRCRPFAAPLDVKLSDVDVVQPDLIVVCDPSQFKGTHIEGAPALVVEILSPSSISHDRLAKMRLYQQAGVGEYWIITPFPPLVEIFRLESARYYMHSGGVIGDVIRSPSFPELTVDLADLFNVPYGADEMKTFEVKESPGAYLRAPPV